MSYGSCAPTTEEAGWLRRLRLGQPMIGAALLLAGATAAAWLAQTLNRPISAALLYLLGVLLIGASAGLRLGLAAAIAASVIHNFFIAEPVLQFSLSTADEYVPLLAFNLSAIVSGALAGRLKDRARAAERASARLDLLLDLSRSLQGTVSIDELGAALHAFCVRTGVGAAEVFAQADGRLLGARGHNRFQDVAAMALEHQRFGPVQSGVTAHELPCAQGSAGVLVHERGGVEHTDWPSIAILLSIAMERCLLFREIAETEAVRRSEEFKTALISSVSHDLRTPLAAITASATSLLSFEEGLSSTDRRSMLAIIRDQAERLNRYTANLLNLGKLQSAVDPSEIDTVDLAELIGVVVGAMRVQAPTHRLEKSVEAERVTVHGNAVMLEQVLRNVIENAARYSPSEGTIHVALRTEQDRALVMVEDEGPGIPPAELGRVFDRFYRGGGASGAEGQGLGLSIARGFAERFGGTIKAISPVTEAGGTRVEIRLPLAPDCGVQEAA